MEEQLQKALTQLQQVQAQLVQSQEKVSALTMENQQLKDNAPNVEQYTSRISELEGQLAAINAQAKSETVKQRALTAGMTEAQFTTFANVMDINKVNDEFDFSVFVTPAAPATPEEPETITEPQSEDEVSLIFGALNKR